MTYGASLTEKLGTEWPDRAGSATQKRREIEMATYFEKCMQKQIEADREYCEKHRIEFTERDVSHANMGDCIRAILAIDNVADASKFYEGYVESIKRCPDRESLPEYVAKSNIGWCFGEGMSAEHIAMWTEVIGNVMPTPEEAFAMGVEAAKK